MPVSKAQQKAVQKYVSEKYDRVMLTLPKGRKAVIQAASVAVGESLNGYVSKAIDERITRQGAAGGGGVEGMAHNEH
jgi:predicted HicB family RNase H-like nuclease